MMIPLLGASCLAPDLMSFATMTLLQERSTIRFKVEKRGRSLTGSSGPRRARDAFPRFSPARCRASLTPHSSELVPVVVAL